MSASPGAPVQYYWHYAGAAVCFSIRSRGRERATEFDLLRLSAVPANVISCDKFPGEEDVCHRVWAYPTRERSFTFTSDVKTINITSHVLVDMHMSSLKNRVQFHHRAPTERMAKQFVRHTVMFLIRKLDVSSCKRLSEQPELNKTSSSTRPRPVTFVTFAWIVDLVTFS